MSRLSDKIEQNFRGVTPKAVVVPEWDTTLFIFPLTLGQLSRIDSEENPFRRAVRAIIVQSKNEDGSPMFDEQDFDKLISHGVGSFGPTVILRVRSEINKTSSSEKLSQEDSEKKS